MVGFGKKLRERQHPAWEQYYIAYKAMKKKVKQYSAELDRSSDQRKPILREFSLMLDRQVEKTVLFLLEKQGELAHRLAELGDRKIALEEGDEDTEEETEEILDSYRAVGKDLLRLLHFVEINATGLRKILKKFDKRIGYRLTDEYVASRSNHQFSQLQQVFRTVGIGAMVGTISRNMTELQTAKSKYSIYEVPSTPTRYPEEPVIEAIRSAQDRLTNSTNFMRFLGTAAFIPEELPRITSEDSFEGFDEPYHPMSLYLNLLNTFLYMVNTYIVVPTADDYALDLGAAATVCGIIIGAMAVAQLVSSVYFSAWSNKSYFGPLIFSSIMLFLGNGLYAVAYDCRSIALLLIGRLLCGFGSARAVNRRYISDCVPTKMRLQASAAFVSASAFGMACGPALAGFLTMETKLFGLTFDSKTLPGWVMAVGWFLYFFAVLVWFKEPVHDPPPPPRSTSSRSRSPPALKGGSASRSDREVEEGLTEPLVSGEAVISKDTDSDDESSVGSVAKPAASFMEAYRLLSSTVKVQLLIYFMLKFAMEVLLAESSVVTSYYFNWTTQNVSLFLALLGLTVLPINFIVGTYLSNMFDDREILLCSEILTCVGIIGSLQYFIFPYTVYQYVSGSILVFVSAEVLEGVNLALLSKVLSSRLSRGTYNGGLLSTEAGTLARVVADVAITLAGSFNDALLLNVTMVPALVIGLVSIGATLTTYNSLF